MKRGLAILLITIGHALLTVYLILQSFSMVMTRFDIGDTTRSASEKIINGLGEILMWPLFSPLTRWCGRWGTNLFSGLLGYIPILLNSLIWALVITWLWKRIRDKSVEQGGPGYPPQGVGSPDP